MANNNHLFSVLVSDIVVLNENGKVKAYFVDSISFRELLDFLQLEPELNQEELAYRIGDQFFTIQITTEGSDDHLGQLVKRERMIPINQIVVNSV